MQADLDGDSNYAEQPILVLGATGQQGGAVARALRSTSRPVRAMVRHLEGEAAQALAGIGVDLVRGDFSDVSSVREAIAGVAGIFSVQPNSGIPGSGITNEDEVRFGKLVADLAVDARVNHLLYSSASIISRAPTGIANLDCKREIEEHVRSLPIATTIVRPATFMELLARGDFWSGRDNFSFFIDPDQPIELIAAEDIGRIAAAILDNPDRFVGQAINIAGDEVTGLQIQNALGSAFGRPIRYRRFPDAVLKEHPAVKRTVELFNSGTASGNADLAALTHLFGPLTRIEDWLKGAGNKLF